MLGERGERFDGAIDAGEGEERSAGVVERGQGRDRGLNLWRLKPREEMGDGEALDLLDEVEERDLWVKEGEEQVVVGGGRERGGWSGRVGCGFGLGGERHVWSP